MPGGIMPAVTVVCVVCAEPFEARSVRSKLCSDRCRKARAASWYRDYYAAGNAYDSACSSCGKGMRRGGTSLGAGEAMCLECRRQVHGYRGYKRGCRCATCRAGVSERETERRRGGAAPTPGSRNGRGTWIDPVKRHRIYERDGWSCGLCGLGTLKRYVAGDPLSPSLDHVVPRSLGGGNEDENLRTAHIKCNAIRGDGHLDITADEYRARLGVLHVSH